MAVGEEIKSHTGTVDYFKELPFYKNHIEKPYITFCYKIPILQTFPILTSDQEFENLMNVLLVIDENKSHYVYIKEFDRFMFHLTNNKSKKYSSKSCLQF